MRERSTRLPATAYIFSDEGFRHDTGPYHPECPERLQSIKDAFARAKLDPLRIAPVRATTEDLARVHTLDHIEAMRRACENEGGYPDPDTKFVKASFDVAMLAAGSAIAACRAVLAGEYGSVFSAMRPPGHHAEADRAMGFCLFNNVAIAAKWLIELGHVRRVAILDWDVHHGNGTQRSTYNDPNIYYCSIHQYPHYPGTGHPSERGVANTNLNVIMPPGAPAEAWIDAMANTVIPEFERFDPEFLLISCGFDAYKYDPLAHQNLEIDHFVRMTHMVKHLANGRIVSLLEGGYNLDALGDCAVAHFRALAEN